MALRVITCLTRPLNWHLYPHNPWHPLSMADDLNSIPNLSDSRLNRLGLSCIKNTNQVTQLLINIFHVARTEVTRVSKDSVGFFCTVP